jgi:hypothetical protein
MSVNRWKLFSMPVVVLGIASPMLIDCGGKLPGGNGLGEALSDVKGAAEGCDEFKSGNFASLDMKGDAKVQSKVKAFLQVSYDVNKVVVDLEGDLITSCAALGKDLGMPEAELKVTAGGGKGAEKVCTAVAAKLKSMLGAQAEAKLAVEFDPPKCYADVDGMMKCMESCGSPIEPGKLEASCSGGEISGSCDAECKGKCTVEAGAECTGTCRAACSGSCSGGCEVKAAAKCSGSCSGGCSATVKEPKCSGEFKPPTVDVECQQSCGNRAAASAKCDPPNVRVTANGKLNTEVTKLISALNKNLPAIIRLSAGTAPKVKVGAEGLVKTGEGMIKVAGDAGGKALACIKAGVDATVNATTSVNLEVKASVSVSASATGKVN